MLHLVPESVTAQAHPRQVVRPQAFRVALIWLCAAMGLSLGTVAGAMPPFFGAPIHDEAVIGATSGSFSHFVPTSSHRIPTPRLVQAVQQVADQASKPARTFRPLQTVEVVPTVNPARAEASSSAAPAAAKRSGSSRSAEGKNTPTAHPTPEYAKPAFGKPEAIPLPAGKPHAKPAHPVRRTLRIQLASLVEAESSLDAGNAKSWNECRPSVHNQCGQGGTCMLTRTDVAALNARVI
jgi:hypothetical protein